MNSLTSLKASLPPSIATSNQSAAVGVAANRAVPQSVRAWQLLDLLEGAAPHVRVLSLDCFDTLLWRRARHPVDVFFEAAKSEAFAHIGLNAKLRISSEGAARSLKLVRRAKREVTLAEIYRAGFPQLSDEEVARLSAAELQAEKEACFAFQPVVELIRAAASKGLRVIIVSDTYLRQPQLRELIESCVPADVGPLIDEIYCSSEYGHSKAAGLFGYVLERLRERAAHVLHVGDNLVADAKAARKKGICGVQLVQQSDYVEELLRLESTVGGMLAPQRRQAAGLPSIFHGLLGSREHQQDGAYRLGYLAMGPILFAFARFVQTEIARLEAQGKRPKPLFLLRDAHLPLRGFSELCPGRGQAVSISRFVSYASSFRSRGEIEAYLARSSGAARFEPMLRQLLLSEKTAQLILRRSKKANDPVQEFIRQVTKDKVVDEIIAASQKYRKTLYRYLEKQVDLSPGDTLLFVDLGYEGTAQRQLGPVFLDEKNVEVRGCYLMASRVPGWQHDRVGLLDPSWCDDRVLGSLVPYVALIEDLCTRDCASVIGYSEEGEPQSAEHVIDAEQFARIVPVQDAAVRFVGEANDYFEELGRFPPMDELRHAAMAGIGRLLFLPTRSEVDYIEGFRLDMNMGTVDSFALFDTEQGLCGLRRRGLFFMERNQEKLRMNYPIELRAAGMELSMTLLAQHRYGLEFARADLSQRLVRLPILVMRGNNGGEVFVDAQCTHDGCFAAEISVGSLDFDLGIALGRLFAWVQLVALDVIPTDKLHCDDESLSTTDCRAQVVLEGCVDHGSGMLELKDQGAFLYLSPRQMVAAQAASGHHVLRVVFRPLVKREGGAL